MSIGPVVLALLFVVLLLPMVSGLLRPGRWRGRTWGRSRRWIVLVAAGLAVTYLIAMVDSPR